MNKYLLSFALSLLGLTLGTDAMDGGSSSSVPAAVPSSSSSFSRFGLLHWISCPREYARYGQVRRATAVQLPGYGQGEFGIVYYRLTHSENDETNVYLKIDGQFKGQVYAHRNGNAITSAKDTFIQLRNLFYAQNPEFSVDPILEALEAKVLRKMGIDPSPLNSK